MDLIQDSKLLIELIDKELSRLSIKRTKACIGQYGYGCGHGDLYLEIKGYDNFDCMLQRLNYGYNVRLFIDKEFIKLGYVVFQENDKALAIAAFNEIKSYLKFKRIKRNE